MRVLTLSNDSIRLTEKCRPTSRRKGMYSSRSSHSALSIITASVGPSPKRITLSKAVLIEAMLAAIVAASVILRWSSRNEGSPILVVPPPMMTSGRPPTCCNRRSIIMLARWPTCRLGAVQS